MYRAREVILSGGTYGSPAVLLCSGIGPVDELTTLGIGVVADLPVGQRLQDQPGYGNAYALAPGYLEMPPAVGSMLWTASTEAVGDELDLHVTATHLLPGSLSLTGGALALLSAVVQPEATGTLKLASRDPGVAPVIDPNYLGTSRDTRRLLEAVKLGRAIARNPVFAPFIAEELTPGDVDTHHHILPDFFFQATNEADHPAGGVAPAPWSRASMLSFPDEAGIDVAVTSISTPGVHTGDDAAARALARRCNELAAEMIRDRPDRFGGFACLPLPDVDGALAELAYAFDDLRLDGVVVIPGAESRATAAETFRHLYWDTAASWGDPVLRMLRDVAGIDHVVFGTDYPYLPHDLAVSCRADIEASPELTESERTAILGATATKLIPRLAALRHQARTPAP